jgi:hypothetical protein
MNKRFNEVLDEASETVAKWPDWRKSEALKLSERQLQDRQVSSQQLGDQLKKQAASA